MTHYLAGLSDLSQVPVTPQTPLPVILSDSGAGGPVTVANGADVVEGTLGDTQAAGTVVGYLKSLWTGFFGTPVAIPVSATSLPLPAGASTSAKQAAPGIAGTASTDVTTVQGIPGMTKLLVTPDSVALPANQSVNVAQLNGNTTDVNSGNKSNGTLRVVLATDQPPLTNALAVDGQTASGSAVANPPVTTGGRTATANPTAVADGQVVNTMHTKLGKLVVVEGAPRELKGSQKTTISNSTAETTIITAGAAGIFNDPYAFIFANSGASTTKVDIRDATGGSIIATIEVPSLETRGWMLSAGSGFPQTTSANNWTAQCTTATTALEVTALYIKTL